MTLFERNYTRESFNLSDNFKTTASLPKRRVQHIPETENFFLELKEEFLDDKNKKREP